MRRDFRGRTEGHEAEIVEGDLADIDACDAVLAAFTAPDEGTAMEAWYAHSRGIPVVVYTGGTPAHPWTTYVAASRALLARGRGGGPRALSSQAGCRAIDANPFRAHPRYIGDPLLGRRATTCQFSGSS